MSIEKRIISMQKSALLSMFAVAFALLSASAYSQSYEYIWAERLMEDFRYEDMAETIFVKLSKDPSKEKAVLGIKGLAKLKRRQALLSDNLIERAKFNAECLEMFRKVSKSLKRDTLPYYETLFDLASTIQDVVGEEIRFINEGRIPSDQQEAVRKRNLNLLAEATNIYTLASGTLEAMTDERAKLLGKQAALDRNVVRLLKAELIGTDPKKLKSPFRNEELRDAVDDLEKFGLFNSGSVWEMYSFIWLGRVHAAQYEGGFDKDRIDIAKVDSDYWYVVEQMSNPDNNPPAAWASVVTQALFWQFEFLNKHGATDILIQHGEDITKSFETLGWDWGYYGRLAQIEFAKALKSVGDSDRALKLAAAVSSKGGYAGQEADKLMSIIIRTAENKDKFTSTNLASGANGAYVAARKNPAKYHEAIALYQIVLTNLAEVKDETERNILGREAFYRIGRCNDKLGRSMESYVALEQAYKRYNNDKLGDNRKINQEISKYWGAVAKDLTKVTSNSSFANELRSRCGDWIIAHPPVGVEGGGDQGRLLWTKARNLLRTKSYPEALKAFEAIASKPSEYQERAMVKVASVGALILRKNKGATAPQWRAAAKKFSDYIAFTKSSKDTDPLRLKARKAALVEAHFQLTECYRRAAEIEPDLAVKTKDYQAIVPHANYVLEHSKDENVLQYCRNNLLVGYIHAKDGRKAYELLQEMLKADRNHKLVPTAALKTSNALRAQFRAMPKNSVEEVEARNLLRLDSVRAFRAYLLTAKKSKSGYWPRAVTGFYELKQWKEAEELIDLMLSRFGSKLPQKLVRYANKRKARCLLERAKIAFRDGKTEEADRLFAMAAPVYSKIVGKKNSGTDETLEEAAQIFGGFLTGENRRGIRKFYPGNSEFIRAAQIWKKLQKRFRKASEDAKSDAEIAALDDRIENARFYTYLMVYQDAKAKKNRKALAKMKKSVQVVFDKTAIPGGKKYNPLWNWLKDQL